MQGGVKIHQHEQQVHDQEDEGSDSSPAQGRAQGHQEVNEQGHLDVEDG